MRLNDMSTSELITIARNYSASIKEIGIYSELVKEITTRLAASTAAANEGCKHAARADALAAANGRLAAESVMVKSKGVELCSEAASVYSKYNKTQMPDRDLVDMQTIQEMRDLINGTPAAALAEIQAQGVDEMASVYRQFAQEDGCSCNMRSSYNLTAERAERVAVYIRRKGAAL